RNVAANADVQARKMRGRRNRENFFPQLARQISVTQMPVGESFLEKDFDVVRANLLALAACFERFTVLSQLIMTLGNEGIEFPDDGVGRQRTCEAAPQERQRFRLPLLLLVDGSDVEEDKGVFGIISQIKLQEAQITLELGFPEGRILVAGVRDC